MQTTARKNDWPLDKTVLITEVTKKLPEQLDGPSKDGAYVHGLTLEGARWDEKSGILEESRPKELFYSMPVSFCIALPFPLPHMLIDSLALSRSVLLPWQLPPVCCLEEYQALAANHERISVSKQRKALVV